jgi:hypothetical protein
MEESSLSSTPPQAPFESSYTVEKHKLELQQLHQVSLTKITAHWIALGSGAFLAGCTILQAVNGAAGGEILGYATAAAAFLTLASRGKPE